MSPIQYSIIRCQYITETSETLAQCKPRIETAIDDLKNVMSGFEEGDAEQFALLKEAEEWKQAEELRTEAYAFIDQDM